MIFKIQKRFSIYFLLPPLLVLLASASFAREYLIYAIAQEVSMGYKDEKVKKNYYINLGGHQGVRSGTILDVFRSISQSDPFNDNKRYQYKVKVGELEVLHSEDQAAIAHLKGLETGQKIPLLEINDFMIGDQVGVHIEK